MKAWDEAQRKEQAKQNAETMRKLRARRNKKQRAELAKIEQAHSNADEVSSRQELDQLNIIQAKSAADLNRSNNDSLRPDDPALWNKKDESKDGLEGGVPRGVSDDWMTTLMNSPLYQQLVEMEEMLKRNAGDGAIGSGVYGSINDPFLDIKDAQWMCHGELTPLDINGITPSQFVIYRFGVFLLRMLRHLVRTPEVTLLLASNLPPNNYDRNMFRNSFFYQHAQNILFVRQERLESVGEFIMVVLHCIAHIKVGDLTDDRNPLFLREFFKLMNIVCQDMFFSRSRTTPAASHLTGLPLTSSKTALETAFRHTKSSDDKANVVGELVNVKVQVPSQGEFGSSNISERTADFQQQTTNARLREFLANHGGAKMSGDYVAGRIGELKGEQPKEGPTKRPPVKKRSSGLKSPKELLTMQINQMESQLDNLNTQVAKVLSDIQSVSEGISRAETTPEVQTDSLNAQLTNLTMKKDNLMKTISQLQGEIIKKEQERQTANNISVTVGS
ncbi:uncharacterized protein [Ptychodera flava]|uniref:uncharacterized protein n=1 Tax=Ptychodera flava TaxID=63121 RepID=UPI00396A266A